MSDYITIDNLEIYAHHGLLEEETRLGQKFVISMKLFLDMINAGRCDDYSQTIDYAQVCEYVTEYSQNHTFKLIEALAENVARQLLKKYALLKAVEITVKKPWAPIGLPVECVMVTMNRSWHRAYLSIGSNLGNKIAQLDYAVKMLGEDENIKNIRTSEYIETKPYGGVEQDDFLNGAIELDTLYSPHELLELTSSIEQDMKRTREIHWGPRTLDIDIVLYDDIVISDDKLTIPHWDMANRDFVLKPLYELNPNLVHPISNKTIRELLAQLNA